MIISITFASINLYNGYVTYTKDGMALGFIEQSGNFQIAKNAYWNNGQEEDSNLDAKDIKEIKNILNKKNISNVECVLEISGLVGNQKASRAFWGEAYDNPEKYCSLVKGEPVFTDDDGVVLGMLLAKTLGFEKELGYVTVLSSSSEMGICLADFDIKGISSSGIVQQDKGFLLASRKSMNDFLGLEDTCSYMKVYFLQNKDNKKFLSQISLELPQQYSIKNWEELNPSYHQINEMNATQFFIISFILVILIFVCLTLSLITTFTERIKEFGTMEALGFTKKQIIFLMLTESFFLSLIGISFGFILVFVLCFFTNKLNITIIPPGYSDGYKLIFIIKWYDYIKTFILIFTICLSATLYPAFNILGKTSANLIKRT